MKTSNKLRSKIQSFDVMQEQEESGFIDGDIDLGKTIKTFTFGGAIAESQPALAKPAAVSVTPKGLIFNASTRGLTPTVDGEPFSIKRGYQFRPSTIRKLNELKAKHPDINIYLNTILDEAINFYYEHVMSNKSS